MKGGDSRFGIGGKIRADVTEWFEAQCVDPDGGSLLLQSSARAAQSGFPRVVKVWEKPPCNWFKCNVGSSWSKRNQIVGGAWVLRDELGVVLFHSRRAFFGIRSDEDAKLRVLLWAIESMANHKVVRVVFACQEKCFVEAAIRPMAWPSFKAQSGAIKSFLRSIPEWKLVLETKVTNKGANLIAQSVTGDLRLQYVVVGFPAWLSSVFESERICPSVC